ncbi:MAG: PAS domain S-box-containing protein [Pseudohongiellaceae bacterium]|jgi:PAS domain S-box-containing protein
MLTEDTTFFLLAIIFIAILNAMIISGIWLSYLTSRKPYLALACFAGVLEIMLHFSDLATGIRQDTVMFYSLANILQFGSTLTLAVAMLAAFGSISRGVRSAILLLSLALGVSVVYEAFVKLPSSPLETYLGSLPLLGASGFLMWRTIFTGQGVTPSKLFFLTASSTLLLIRLALPAMPIDNLYLLFYYIEYMCFSMILIAIILYEIEYSNRKVKSLLDSKVQSEQDLQFIVDNSFDIILVADKQGLLRSWSKKAQQVFGYSPEQAVGKIHLDGMFVDNFLNRELGAVDEFHARMVSIEGKSFMVDVRLKEVSYAGTSYSIFVLRLIEEPGSNSGINTAPRAQILKPATPKL